MNIKIIATQFNKNLIGEMVTFAQAELEKLGIAKAEVFDVAGCFEAPLLAQKLLAKSDTDALIILGYIEKGETLHGEVMGYVVHEKLVDLQLKYEKPVGLGIIGPGATLDQARTRTGSRSAEAVRAVVQSLETLRKI